jgi:hypothetical protein
MKLLIVLLSVICFNAWSQDPTAYLTKFDHKVYSLKTKGIKDFVVDIESTRLTTQMNDQMIFGQVKKVIFRTYWTANPERIAIEVVGLPEGFREIKEELKIAILGIMDNLIPIPMAQRFAGYKISAGPGAKEFTAQDTTGIAAIAAYVLSFDSQDLLSTITAKKPIGTMVITPKYEKESFSDTRWVLKSQVSVSSENGQTITVSKNLDYGTIQGIGVLTEVEVSTEQKFEGAKSKPLKSGETLEFKNYKINTGEALKYFLGEANKATP